MKQMLLILCLFICGCSAKQNFDEKGNMKRLINPTDSKHTLNLIAATTCNQTNLSNQFDLLIKFKRYTDTLARQDSCTLHIIIKDKDSEKIRDNISLTSFFYFDNIFSSCDRVTSYSTNCNTEHQIIDNYFGDIVVADLNFDNKDDIAVINDSGGNGGPLYSYFVQSKEGKFVLDAYLTDSVTYFPYKIDKTTNRLVTNVHAGACCVGVHIYHLDKKMNKWSQLSHKIKRQY